MIRRGRRVFCDGCANLLFLGGKSPPLCVATAHFEPGPIRRRVEVVGVVPAEGRNWKNDCPYHTMVSLHAWKVKRWLIWRLNDGVSEGERARERKIREYPVKVESNHRIKLQESRTERETPEDPYEKVDLEYEERGEDVLDVGGAGDIDESGSSDTDGREDVQDP